MGGPPPHPRSALRSDPSKPVLRWRAGDPRYAEALETPVRSLLGKGDLVEVLREKPGRRRLARARLASGELCFLKQVSARGGGWKRRLGLTPAARELRALRQLSAAAVPVPEPLARFTSGAGDEVLVSRFLEGEPLAVALARPPRERRRLLHEVGALVARMHAAGICHRDLHRENVWVTPAGPVLIDLQQALPSRARWLRRRDLGELDASLAPLLSLPDRLRLRAAALGLSRPFGARDRALLRAVGRASQRRHRAHVESRTRRSLRPGRLYARFRCTEGRGMRLRSQPEDALRQALAGSGGVLRFRTPGWRPGTPARDAWLAGHGLRARGIGAPLPLAFVERRAMFAGVASAVVLEPARAADPEGSARWLDEVIELGVALRRHRVAIAHDAVLCRDARGALGPTGLEAIRFRRRLGAGEARRIDALVEGAVADAGIGGAERASALRRYARRVAFSGAGRP